MRRLLTLIVLLLISAQAPAQGLVKLPHTSATLECYPANNDNSTAIIVCPGGSYSWLDYQVEGVDVAKWLQANGISAYVLRYRVQGWWAWATHYRLLFRGHRHPDPITDATTAVDWLCLNADSLGIDTSRIGIMGFSAGGHLAVHTAIIDLRIAFAAAIYPVVTMTEKCTHKRSRRALLGEYGKYKQSLRDALSLEKRVHTACPPIFLVNCVDDPIVDYRNSELLDSALCANNVPHRYIQYATGGHGFGASNIKGSAECRQWRSEFLEWLPSIIIKKTQK